MRLWTIHPKHLDGLGLVALWREALLARAVLRGNTRGYRHHPQLIRFRAQPRPVDDRRKLGRVGPARRITETQGQVAAEWEHLLRKLQRRQPARYRQLIRLTRPEVHPLFRVVPGAVRTWERARGDDHG